MKILLYTTAFAPSVGGVETYVMLLAKGLAAQSVSGRPIQVTVATATTADGFDDAALPFSIVRQPSLLEFVKLSREADIIQVAGPCLAQLALAWLMRKPVVIEHHAYQAACPNGLFLREPMKEICPGYFEQRRYAKCMSCVAAEYGSLRGAWKVLSTFPRRWLTRRVAQNVCVSEYVEHRLDLPRSRVVYHGIPSLEAETDRTHDAANVGILTFGYVGRFVAEKNLITLVNAAKIVAEAGCDFRIKLVGDGPERQCVEAAVQGAGLATRTTFTGFLSGAALEEAVSEMSVVVMPSIWEETFGLSALEHMRRGRLVIAADLGGLAEVVDGAGLKFKPGDAESLAARIRKVIECPEILAEYGRKGRERANCFALESMVRNHLGLYLELISRS